MFPTHAHCIKKRHQAARTALLSGCGGALKAVSYCPPLCSLRQGLHNYELGPSFIASVKFGVERSGKGSWIMRHHAQTPKFDV
jgi:hypothetical protein